MMKKQNWKQKQQQATFRQQQQATYDNDDDDWPDDEQLCGSNLVNGVKEKNNFLC